MDAAFTPGSGMVSATTLRIESVREIVGQVVDPEIPVLTIEDLGILRDVQCQDGQVVVDITPTYSGCPAMGQIAADVTAALANAGIEEPVVRMVHSPAWTTDWITEDGRRKLDAFGIAPPSDEAEIVCPRCRSGSPQMVARFGSTACKALMVCQSCGEPFDYFKEF